MSKISPRCGCSIQVEEHVYIDSARKLLALVVEMSRM
jgi:hypothetical protein